MAAFNFWITNLFIHYPFFGTVLHSRLPRGQGSPAAASQLVISGGQAAKRTLLEVLIGKFLSPYLEVQAWTPTPPPCCQCPPPLPRPWKGSPGSGEQVRTPPATSRRACARTAAVFSWTSAAQPERGPTGPGLHWQRPSEELAPASPPPGPPAAKMSASNVSLLRETSRQVVAGGSAGKVAGSPRAGRSPAAPHNVPKAGRPTEFRARPLSLPFRWRRAEEASGPVLFSGAAPASRCWQVSAFLCSHSVKGVASPWNLLGLWGNFLLPSFSSFFC